MGELNLNSSNLDEVFYLYWTYISKASQNSQYLYKELSTEEFIKFVSLRNHKSRGTDIENRIAQKNLWKKVSRADESGDLIDTDGKFVEVKSSIVTPNKGSKITLRGFRNWELKVNRYLAVIVDVRNFTIGVKSHIFNIPTSLITSENGFKPYTQSGNARQGNKNIPLGISFEIGDKTFLDWEKKYKTEEVKF